jgi:hypothetical protein
MSEIINPDIDYKEPIFEFANMSKWSDERLMSRYEELEDLLQIKRDPQDKLDKQWEQLNILKEVKWRINIDLNENTKNTVYFPDDNDDGTFEVIVGLN